MSVLPKRPVRPRGGALWTSAEVARAFRVGVSSIKRWTDEGELESIKTPGKHRRYTLEAIHRFASIRKIPVDLLPQLDGPAKTFLPKPAEVTLFNALRDGDAAAVRQLVTPHVSDLSKRASFFDRVVGDALREIGERWQRGDLGVEEEHRASFMISEALDRLRAPIESDDLALLTCPPDELHDLPLRIVRLIFEWKGWRTDFLGAQLPWSAIRAAVDDRRPRILALSARTSEPFLYTDFDRLVAHCHRIGTKVIVGGEWARGGAGSDRSYLRFRTLRGFERWLRAGERRAMAS